MRICAALWAAARRRCFPYLLIADQRRLLENSCFDKFDFFIAMPAEIPLLKFGCPRPLRAPFTL